MEADITPNTERAGPMIDFMRHVLAMPSGWTLWVFLLMAVNMIGPLFFLGSVEARVVLGTMAVAAVLMIGLFKVFGFVRLLGLAHSPWLFLLPWLALRVELWPPEEAFGWWLLGVVSVNGVSLLIDVVDVARWLAGDRKEVVTVG